MTHIDFYKAPVMTVADPDGYVKQESFISTAQYPRGFEAEDDEIGMIVNEGVIEHRLFHLSKSWPW